MKKLLLLFILCFFTKSLLANTNDTVIDCKENWQYIKSLYKNFYMDSTKNKLSKKDKNYLQDIIENKLTLVTVYYLGFDNKPHIGQLVCTKSIEQNIKNIFADLLKIKFQIQQVKPICFFGFDDITSMEANNTNAFDYRVQVGSRKLSKHSYGVAIDINPIQNPYLSSKKSLPKNYNNSTIGRVRSNELLGKQVINIFNNYGWHWGGKWKRLKDYMHFEK